MAKNSNKSTTPKRGTFLEDMDLVLPYARATLAGEPAEKTPEIEAALKRLAPVFQP